MANVLTTSMLDTHNNDSCNEDKEIKYFDSQFSENDVLELQQMFVTFGVHSIKTKDVQSGRKIIQTILGSLKHFQNVGAITHVPGLENSICDILVYIKMQGFCSDDISVDLENFFTIHPCFDFIWVEFANGLEIKDVASIKNIFEMYHAQDQMPVIFVMYENDEA